MGGKQGQAVKSGLNLACLCLWALEIYSELFNDGQVVNQVLAAGWEWCFFSLLLLL